MKVKKCLYGILGVVFLLILDQMTKYQAALGLKGTKGISLIPGIFELQYLENRGAAFGLFQNQRLPLLIVTFIILVLLLLAYLKLPEDKHYDFLRMTGVLLAAGAVGNMFDRLYQGYVIDFFYLKCIDFPIFNLADCYVVISAILFLFLGCFYYEEKDFTFFRKKKPKENKKGNPKQE